MKNQIFKPMQRTRKCKSLTVTLIMLEKTRYFVHDFFVAKLYKYIFYTTIGLVLSR